MAGSKLAHLAHANEVHVHRRERVVDDVLHLGLSVKR
jgi:hypothetical protein